MTEPLTTGLLVTLEVQEFVKSGTGDLAKRFTAEALAKIPVLWEKIKTRLMGRSAKVNEAIANIENGDSTAVETLTKNLDVILDEDPDFAKELKVLAQTIQAGKIQDNSSMIQKGSSVKRDTLIWVLPSENDCKAYSVGQKLKPFQGRLSRLKLVPIQNNSDNAKGWQTKVEGGTAYIGEIHIQQGQQPKT